MSKYDYSNGIIDKSNRKRYYFFSEFSKILTMYESTSEEVNELIKWLYTLRNVWVQDLRLYSLVAAVHETGSWGRKDVLSEITFEIYKKLNDIIHPNPRPGLDYEEVRYYSEVEYISKDEQIKIKKEHNIDFDEKNWRA